MSVRTYVESRKLGFFVGEQILLFGAFVMTAQWWRAASG